MRTYGKLWLEEGRWHLECEPHVAMWAKRIFPRIKGGSQGVLKLTNTNAVCRDLEWMLTRFPLEVQGLDTLKASSAAHQEQILTLDRIVGEGYLPREFKLALPPRKYQCQAADLFLANHYLLLADDLGLGKTVSALTALSDPRTLPACVVTLAHLPGQWEKEVNRFLPDLFVHVLKKATPYELPCLDGRSPDVLISSYHKLKGWATVLGSYCNSVVYDECQELRRTESDKYTSAHHLSQSVEFRLGLSATPIYNFGGEIFNVVDCLQPGILGTYGEFVTEWCEGYANKERLTKPHAFGSWLREQHIMLRRTRRDVGRELPPLQRIVQRVDSDPAALQAIQNAAGELARIILAQGESRRGEKMQAAEEFNNLMRQATGIAKAPYVAEFVRMLIENGEPVVLFGWHRAVYDIWQERLKEYSPAMYTGSETPAKKQAEKDRFVSGQTPLMLISLRSGAGLDGLQQRCRTVVIGELDWSPAVIEQNIGRVFRDGQPDPVTAYFLLADDGADPIMSETLGLKREQIEGLRDLGKTTLEKLDVGGANVKKLAEQYLSKHGKAHHA